MQLLPAALRRKALLVLHFRDLLEIFMRRFVLQSPTTEPSAVMVKFLAAYISAWAPGREGDRLEAPWSGPCASNNP